jgi:hypothetical protein
MCCTGRPFGEENFQPGSDPKIQFYSMLLLLLLLLLLLFSLVLVVVVILLTE